MVWEKSPGSAPGRIRPSEEPCWDGSPGRCDECRWATSGMRGFLIFNLGYDGAAVDDG